MSGCPFGFGAAAGAHAPADLDDGDSPDASPKRAAEQKASKCPFSGDGAGAGNDERFNYDKDPVAWFYQNQIKSEEEFQSRKADLREAAKERLESIFEKKGKHLIVDSDDDFSINTSELSAWDSDVYSIRTLASCANSWAEGADFKAPALITLRILLLASMATAIYSGWRAVQGLLSVNRFLGIITVGYVPGASLAAASMVAVAATVLWYMTDSKSKAGLLGGQLAMQVLSSGCTLLGLLCWLFPVKVDQQFQHTLCKPGGPKPTEAVSKLCGYLPMIQEQIDLVISTLCTTNGLLAGLCLAVACAGSWHLWELAYVEKKAAKHKRRRKQRKNAIPWDKIKIENIGPISYCGAAPPAKRGSTAAAASAAGVAAATTTTNQQVKKTL